MKLLTSIFALTLLTTAFAHAEEAKDAKKEEMMKAWQEASTPGAPHKMLASMAGTWSYTSKMWETPDAKPEESKGTSTMKMILGGRYLQHDTKGKAMGMPFNGMGLTGYDNVKGEYNTFWIDNMGTAMMTGKGKFDDSTKTLTDTGEFSCPMTPSKTQSYRGEWKIVDKNNMVYTMYSSGMNPDGPQFKNMEMTFKRK